MDMARVSVYHRHSVAHADRPRRGALFSTGWLTVSAIWSAHWFGALRDAAGQHVICTDYGTTAILCPIRRALTVRVSGRVVDIPSFGRGHFMADVDVAFLPTWQSQSRRHCETGLWVAASVARLHFVMNTWETHSFCSRSICRWRFCVPSPFNHPWMPNQFTTVGETSAYTSEATPIVNSKHRRTQSSVIAVGQWERQAPPLKGERG